MLRCPDCRPSAAYVCVCVCVCVACIALCFLIHSDASSTEVAETSGARSATAPAERPEEEGPELFHVVLRADPSDGSWEASGDTRFTRWLRILYRYLLYTAILYATRLARFSLQ